MPEVNRPLLSAEVQSVFVTLFVCVSGLACLAFCLSFKSVWSFLKVLRIGYFLLFSHSFSTLASETNGRFLYLTDCWLTSSGICRKEAVQSVSVCVWAPVFGNLLTNNLSLSLSSLWWCFSIHSFPAQNSETLSFRLFNLFMCCFHLIALFFCQALYWNVSYYYSHISAIYSVFKAILCSFVYSCDFAASYS